MKPFWVARMIWGILGAITGSLGAAIGAGTAEGTTGTGYFFCCGCCCWGCGSNTRLGMAVTSSGCSDCCFSNGERRPILYLTHRNTFRFASSSLVCLGAAVHDPSLLIRIMTDSRWGGGTASPLSSADLVFSSSDPDRSDGGGVIELVNV